MNVILIILDSLRKDHVGAYGNDWIQTPNLDALSDESLRFTRSYPESVPTIPARRAIHTGMRSFPFRDWKPPEQEFIRLYGWQPIPDGQPTLAQILQSAGYETLLITDTQHQFKPTYNFHRGFSVFNFVRGQERDFYKPHWMCPQEELSRCLMGGWHQAKQEIIMRQHLANTRDRRTEEDWFAPQVFLRSMEFLEGAKEQQPFFMVVDSFDPHEPWDPPDRYVDLYDDPYDGPEPWTTSYGSTDYMSDRQIQRMRALYAGEVTLVDRWLGHFLEKVDELGMAENTLLMLLSDHGHALGDRGVAGKIPSEIYPELIDIPFFIRHPDGRRAGESSDYYASVHDIAPTILGMSGVEPSRPMDGQDLSGMFEGRQPAPRPHFTIGYNDHVWARDERYAMISRNDGENQRLYDLEADPDMRSDISSKQGDTAKRMFEDYVLADAGGPLPRY
jgi:arylsulfatase A-like enzyme